MGLEKHTKPKKENIKKKEKTANQDKKIDIKTDTTKMVCWNIRRGLLKREKIIFVFPLLSVYMFQVH